ncbi:MAG: sulfotransferase domain-containing protein [Sandaracinaceae bacterium]|nr:sulfotransferase domain-containing protein [Sandaracinaceae bacterium]
MKHLDFVVIGAPKSGTTTLFHLIEDHPELALPAGKEAPYFSRPDRLAAGWDAYATEQFGDAPTDRRWGTITPQYFADPAVPARLAEHSPRLRLVALLRNPIDRTFSYFRMLRREGTETRDFGVALREMIGTAAEDRERPFARETRAQGYLVRSEYARCLERYVEALGPESLLVHFAEELRDDPRSVVRSVLGHLGVDPSYVPDELGREFHRGGDAQRFPWLVPLLSGVAPVRRAWRRLPEGWRKRLYLLWDTELNIARDQSVRLEPRHRRELRDFFAPDVARLEAMLGRPAPWADFATELPSARAGARRG